MKCEHWSIRSWPTVSDGGPGPNHNPLHHPVFQLGSEGLVLNSRVITDKTLANQISSSTTWVKPQLVGAMNTCDLITFDRIINAQRTAMRIREVSSRVRHRTNMGAEVR